MTNESWEKIEQLFHTALDLSLEDRKSYLQRECASNMTLYSEVESLLKNFESNSNFLGEPVFELGLEAINNSFQKNLSGLTIGYYELQEKIGAGGMGEVYKAFDTQLNRTVALKFLSESLENDNIARRQLLKEAQAVARLEHPNICAVYGIEQSNEHHFIVMQYIEGQTLAESIGEAAIPVERFKLLARQIVTAVAAAHSHGVIHRDLKPGNIMLTTDGQIKILDFGLAKVIQQKQNSNGATDSRSNFSQNGLIVGTVSYMSPEQLRGEKVDHQSDIFSVGVILYELLAKTNPFSRKSQAETIAAILGDARVPLEKLKPDFPSSLIKLVERCLQKAPEKRFQSAAEILVQLDKIESGNHRQTATRYRSLFVKTVLATIFSLAIFAFGFYFYSKRPPRTLAVLPFSFDNLQSDKEYLADGMTQGLIDKLSNLSDLDVKSESLVNHYKGKAVEPQNAGRDLNVDAVFVGNIQQRTEGLIFTFKLIRVYDGLLIDSNEEKIDETKLIELPENIASRIISKIQMKLTDEDNKKLTKKDTESETAKELYMQGRFYLKQRNDTNALNKAIKFFTDAKDLDQKYAKAWAGLADAYINQSTPGVNGAITPEKAVMLAKPAAYKALDLDNTLCEAYNSLGLIASKYEFKWSDAESDFKMAISLDNEFLSAHFGLVGILIIQGRFDEALKEAKKIKEIDPLSSDADLEIAKIYYMKKDFGQSDKILSDLLERIPDNKRAIYLRSYLFLNTGKLKEAIELLESMYKSDNEADKIFAAAPLGFAYAKDGRRDEAVKIIEKLGKFRKSNYVPAQEKALIYVGLGDLDKVFENLKQSCDEKFYALPSWVIDPVVDEVKSDARFTEIRNCVNLNVH